MMDKLGKQIATALTSDTLPLFETLDGLIKQLAPVLAEKKAEQSRFSSGSKGAIAGHEYIQAVNAGNPEEVRAIAEKHERLCLEVEILARQDEQLKKLRLKARIREAYEGLPRLHSELVEHVEQAESAAKALEAALDRLDDAYAAVTTARGSCHMGGLKGAGASMETIQRLDALIPYATKRRKAINRAGHHADSLGVDHSDNPAARWAS